MGKSADQLREEIDHDRSDAGQKIDDLQGQLEGQATKMQQQAQDTADHVRDQAQGVVNDAVESVQSFDFNQQVQERPLVSVGVALLGGFVLGGMMGGGGGHQRSGQYYGGGETTGGSQQVGGGHSGGGISSGLRSAAQKSGLEDTISNAAAALMGSVTEQVKGTLDSRFPGYSEKLETAEHSSGSFTDKAKATQKEAQQA